MPIYEYRCPECGELTSLVCAVNDLQMTTDCEHCGTAAQRIISRPSVHLSKTSKLEKLDPKYDKMVDHAMQTTQNAEPDQVLKRVAQRASRKGTSGGEGGE